MQIKFHRRTWTGRHATPSAWLYASTSGGLRRTVCPPYIFAQDSTNMQLQSVRVLRGGHGGTPPPSRVPVLRGFAHQGAPTPPTPTQAPTPTQVSGRGAHRDGMAMMVGMGFSHLLARRVSVHVAPSCSSLHMAHLGIAHTFMVSAGVVYTPAGRRPLLCGGLGGLRRTVAARWSLASPTPVPLRVPSLSSTILRTGQTALQGPLRWPQSAAPPARTITIR